VNYVEFRLRFLTKKIDTMIYQKKIRVKLFKIKK
jgi:hypothetical protein